MESDKKNKTQIKIEIDDNIGQGEYANFAIVTHSAAEFVMTSCDPKLPLPSFWYQTIASYNCDDASASKSPSPSISKECTLFAPFKSVAMMPGVENEPLPSFGYKAILPSAIHLNADWNFNNLVFICVINYKIYFRLVQSENNN